MIKTRHDDFRCTLVKAITVVAAVPEVVGLGASSDRMANSVKLRQTVLSVVDTICLFLLSY